MKRQFTAWSIGLLLTIFLAGCGAGGSSGGGGGDDGGGNNSATLVSIALTPGDSSIAIGTTRQFTATGTYSDSTTKDLTASVAWVSSDPSVATISDSAGSKGLATAGTPGSTTITATLGSISGNTTLTVTAPPQSSLILPETGQTTSYGANDDGLLRKGVPWPSPRFTVGTDAEADCVTDNLTGLMWAKSPDSTKRTWAAALTYANDSNLCVHDDWRLPNRNELRSLVNYGESNSATWLGGEGFSNVQADQYWSSTTYAPYSAWAWTIDMGDGSVGAPPKNGPHYVWSVR